MNEDKKKPQLQIELDKETSKGEYSNFAIVTHSPAEFVMDFAQLLPGMPKANVRSRIVMAPTHAKTLMRILQDNIQKFEAKYGEIKTLKQPGQVTEFKLPKDSLPN
jgi:hypothetical protein